MRLSGLNYTYDTVEHLTSVVMPRSTATQTRTLNYNQTTLTLDSENHPETGLTCYSYGPDSSGRGHTLLLSKVEKGSTGPTASCTDIGGKTTKYTYDSYSRVTQISRFPEGAGEDICQRTNYLYDTTGLPNGNAWGRLGQSSTGDSSCTVFAGVNGGASQQRQFGEQFNYNQIGQVLTKRLIELQSADNGTPSSRYWDVIFSYNATDDKLLDSMTYPDTKDATGALIHAGYTVSYTYDRMGRQSGMSYTTTPSDNSGHVAISGATYNAANQLVSIPAVFNGIQPTGQSRTYNVLNQLTSISYGPNTAFKYNFNDGQNNGQIQSMVDYTVTSDPQGQTNTYSYDSLKRLATASAPGAWNQTYTYDGFGNLTAKSGSSPQTLLVDASTNRLASTQSPPSPFTGFCYDKYGRMFAANGNCQQQVYSYDVANRMTGSGASASSDKFMYDAHNQRVAVVKQDGTEQMFFYDPSGKKLATINYAGPPSVVENVYFAGLLWQQGLNVNSGSNEVMVDRLGSIRGAYFNYPQLNITPRAQYLPYGEDFNSTANNREKFATYTRDNSTGFDYANQRYYSSAFGRFLTADPFKASAGPEDPASWNRYSYVGNDPANYNDASGRVRCLTSSTGNCVNGNNDNNDFDGWDGVGDPFHGGGTISDYDGPTGGVGGGGLNTFGPAATPIRVTNFSQSGSKQDAITGVFQKIGAALSQYSDCLDWLQGGAIIGALVDNNSFGYGDFNVSSVAAFAGQRNADGSSTGVSTTAALTVNSNGAFFNSGFSVGARGFAGGTLQAEATILIHELAHIIGADGFKPDFNNKQNGTDNDKLVDKNCGKLIGGLR